MFENERTARYVLERFLNVNEQMDQTIIAIEPTTSPEEYQALKRSVGYVMYEVFDKLSSQFASAIHRSRRQA